MAPFYVCATCETKYAPQTTGLHKAPGRRLLATKPMGIEMRPEKNHIYVIEMADFGPFAVWLADLWMCPKCGHTVIAGFGVECIAEHYRDDFEKVLAIAKASPSVYYF